MERYTFSVIPSIFFLNSKKFFLKLFKLFHVQSATYLKKKNSLKYVPSQIHIKNHKMSVSFIPFSSHLTNSFSQIYLCVLPYQHFQLTRWLLYETTPKIPFFSTGISFKRANKASFPNNSILYRMRCAYKEEMFL